VISGGTFTVKHSSQFNINNNNNKTGVGMVAVLAAERKLIKYSNLPTNLIFQPIAVENLEAFSSSSSDFISALGHKNQQCVWRGKRNFVIIITITIIITV